MAAPDTVYRYYTNLQTKDSNGNVLNIRAAKPLLSYTDLATFKDKFKLSGVLWINNPDVPPANDAYDAGDSNRDGIIGYVKTDNSDGMAAFHDIREGTFGSDSNSKDYATRTWSRRALLKVLNGVECIILNDAGLNRRADVSVLRPYYPFCNKFSIDITVKSSPYNTTNESTFRYIVGSTNVIDSFSDIIGMDKSKSNWGGTYQGNEVHGDILPIDSTYNTPITTEVTTKNEEGTYIKSRIINLGDRIHENGLYLFYKSTEPTYANEYDEIKYMYLYQGGRYGDITIPHYGYDDIASRLIPVGHVDGIPLYSNSLLDYNPITETYNNTSYKAVTGWYTDRANLRSYYVDSNGNITTFKTVTDPEPPPTFTTIGYYAYSNKSLEIALGQANGQQTIQGNIYMHNTDGKYYKSQTQSISNYALEGWYVLSNTTPETSYWIKINSTGDVIESSNNPKP